MGSQLAGVKFGRDDKGSREVLDIGKYSINIKDGSGLALA